MDQAARSSTGWSCAGRALAALTHPLPLAGLALLILNDHHLKAAHPSWLTGKLSDFGGLLFFPFLLALALSLLALMLGSSAAQARATHPRGASESTARRAAGASAHTAPPPGADRLGPSAFIASALVFALVKTWEPANAAYVALLELLLAQPIRVIRDPSDLLALVALWPAWRVWRDPAWMRPKLAIKVSPSQQAISHTALILVAAWATAATSRLPSPGEEEVGLLALHDGRLYARVASWSAFVADPDDATNWKPVQPIDDRLQAALDAAAGAASDGPPIDCSPTEASLCYKAGPGQRVYRSRDGGDDWEIVWQPPPGRDKFPKRYYNTPGYWQDKLFGGPLPVRENPTDLLVTDTEAGPLVAVARGNQGLLIGEPEGNWILSSIGMAVPAPWSIPIEDISPLTYSYIVPEVILAGFLAGLAYVLAWWRTFGLFAGNLRTDEPHGSQVLARARAGPASSLGGWLTPPLFAGASWLACNWAMTLMAPVGIVLIALNEGEPLALAIALLLGTLSALVVLRALPAFVRREPSPIDPWPFRLAGLRAALPIFFLAVLPFWLWIYAIIPRYGLAAALAGLSSWVLLRRAAGRDVLPIARPKA